MLTWVSLDALVALTSKPNLQKGTGMMVKFICKAMSGMLPAKDLNVVITLPEATSGHRCLIFPGHKQACEEALLWNSSMPQHFRWSGSSRALTCAYACLHEAHMTAASSQLIC